ncbi:MAG: molybdenum cofactor guanylyltransferase [Chloroflexota bacterium]
MDKPQGFSLAILAGGKSSRMGRDKGLLPFQGMTMVEYILKQVEGLGADTFIISNHPENYQGLGLPVYKDVIPDIGTLGGVYSAVAYAIQPFCIVLACDMPFINRELLDYLLSFVPDYDVIVPRIKAQEFAEPLRGVYGKSCLQPIEETLAAGQRRVVDFFDKVHVRYVEKSEVERFDPQGLSFFNVNRMADLREAERIAETLL